MDLQGALLLAALGLGAVSFWPSARGHWSGPVLAFPSVFLGGALLVAVIREGGRVYAGIILMTLLYLAFGIGSILLWRWRRRWRPRWQQPNED